MVHDEERPAFHRTYAWYRLLRHWCGLRFHDTAGLTTTNDGEASERPLWVADQDQGLWVDRDLSVLPIYCPQEA